MSRSRILAEIQNAKHCVLATHFQPDGDALGSVLALGEGIRAMGIPCTVLSPGEAPANLQFMPLLSLMQNEMPEDADVFIALDAAEAARVAPDPAFIQKAKRTICIDHHRSNTGYMDLNWIDPDAGSTSEMVYALLAESAKMRCTYSIKKESTIQVSADSQFVYWKIFLIASHS
jgi:phosphoesterase RecJ-like protein